MTNWINDTDKLIDFIFNRNKISDKQREELREATGTGHGYTTNDTEGIHIGLDLGSGESFSVRQNWRSDNNV